METIKIQTEVDDNHQINIKLPDHIRKGHHEMVLIIDNDKPQQPSVDIMKYSGKIRSWPEDPLDYQQQLRNEWD